MRRSNRLEHAEADDEHDQIDGDETRKRDPPRDDVIATKSAASRIVAGTALYASIPSRTAKTATMRDAHEKSGREPEHERLRRVGVPGLKRPPVLQLLVEHSGYQLAVVHQGAKLRSGRRDAVEVQQVDVVLDDGGPPHEVRGVVGE
ncbi:MAG: hypothetical protein M3N49_11525, partial [Candidatus Eremiobacteraeota bacterium]|nr:hypothetical protein [Candidatus Eremiobacteraeota bacterium]